MIEAKRIMIVIAKSNKAKFLVAWQNKDGTNSENHFFSAAIALANLTNYLSDILSELEYYETMGIGK
jgi:hypothetical protein